MCWDNFITVKGCGRTSTSGVYSNDIGIDIDFLNAVSTKGVTGVNLWDDKLEFTGKVIASQVISHLANKFTGKTLLEGKRAGFAGTGTKAAGPYGFQMYLCDSTSYLDIYVPNIEITLTGNDTIDVTILDAYTGAVLDTFAGVSVLAGIPKQITIDKTYTALRKNHGIIITHNGSEASVTTTVKENGCAGCPKDWVCGTSFMKVQGVVNDGGWKSHGHTGGISVVYSVGCNYEEWICSIKNKLLLPVLYKTGLEIIEYALLASPNTRTNTSVTFNKDNLKEWAAMLDAKYAESMDAVLGNMNLPNDSRCFVCNNKTRHAIILP